MSHQWKDRDFSRLVDLWSTSVDLLCEKVVAQSELESETFQQSFVLLDVSAGKKGRNFLRDLPKKK